MERTVPKTGGEEIQLYMRTYYSLLRSSGVIQIETLVESHIAMQSSLHVGAAKLQPDVSSLLYSALRLPPCIKESNLVLIGQTEQSFVDAGYHEISQWTRVYAPGRRRRTLFDGKSTLVVYIASRSDIDDLVPILTAYQIEWNKLHLLLKDTQARQFLEQRRGQETRLSESDIERLSDLLRMERADLKRLEIVWQDEFVDTLLQVAGNPKNIGIALISGSLADYRRATASWWEEMRQAVLEADGPDVEQHPIYFVSSNTHSLVNLLTGFAHRHEQSLLDYVKDYNYEALLLEYEDIQKHPQKSLENFLYYVLGKYLSDTQSGAIEQIHADERSVGIYRVPNKHGFEIEAQVIDVSTLHNDWMDKRLLLGDMTALSQSNALILNIDYPLGMAAYEMLSRISERTTSRLQGVYILGKAATLNGRIGDVMIPNVIHDEHSQNTYLFDNVFCAEDVKPYMSLGNVMDNQKAVTALGTYLQNSGYMSVFYREGYTDIEMEGGPYLSAVYEAFRPKRHPSNEIVNLYQVPFDIGFLHYGSDTPMKHGQNLGAGSMSYTGIEPAYATAIAILRRIFVVEMRRLQGNVGC
ncbi:MAG: hypothetical protein Q9P44_05960 [Anaerolineae bacterium]|nr:hypothetical protein [Anaerolineae bacterium]